MFSFIFGRGKLDRILTLVETIHRSLRTMSDAVERLTAEVAESQQVTQSAITLITGLAQQIRDLKDDPAALEELASSLDASNAALAAAVAANTPAAEEPPAEESGEGSGGEDDPPPPEEQPAA